MRDSNAKFYTMKPLHWSEGPIKILGIYISGEHERKKLQRKNR